MTPTVNYVTKIQNKSNTAKATNIILYTAAKSMIYGLSYQGSRS
jgi:hypothetical protein